jgi:serine/threonine-protein kinase HipA
MPSHRVLLHGSPIAVLQKTEIGFSLVFEAAYREQAPRPVLGQWFIDRNLDKQLTFKRLPFWFANLLPEGWLRDVISDQMGEHDDEFNMLGVLGNDLPGAVTIEPDQAAAVLSPVRRELSPPRREPLPDRMDRMDRALRFSLAGVQPKLSVER